MPDGPVGLENWVTPAELQFARHRPGRHDEGHEHIADVPAASPGSTDVVPARLRWWGQGRGNPGTPASGGGAAPTGAPPRSSTRRPGGVGGVVAAAAPPALVGVLRHPSDTASVASGGWSPDDGPTRMPGRAGRPSTTGSVGWCCAWRRKTRPGGTGASKVSWSAWAIGGGQHRVEDPPPGRHRPRAAAVRAHLATVPDRPGPHDAGWSTPRDSVDRDQGAVQDRVRDPGDAPHGRVQVLGLRGEQVDGFSDVPPDRGDADREAAGQPSDGVTVTQMGQGEQGLPASRRRHRPRRRVRSARMRSARWFRVRLDSATADG